MDNPKWLEASSTRHSGSFGGCGCKMVCAVRRFKKSRQRREDSHFKFKKFETRYLVSYIAIMKLKLLLTSLFISATSVFAAMPKAGDPAPLFTGQDQDGNAFKLPDLVGKQIDRKSLV